MSILGSMRLRSRALHILAAMDVRVIPRYILAYPRSPFLGKRRMRLFVHISFDNIVKFKSFAQFPVDHLSYLVMYNLVLLLC